MKAFVARGHRGPDVAWIDAGRLRPVLHRTYPLAEVREAFAELERGRARGKIVVTIAP